MTTSFPNVDPRLVAEQGMRALSQGDAVLAAAIFSKLYESGQADQSVHYAMAVALQRQSKFTEALAFVDQALPAQSDDFLLLLLKADLMQATADERGAAAFYLAATRVVEKQDAAKWPDAVKNEAARARAMCGQYANRIEARIDTHLTAEQKNSPRIKEALSILMGYALPHVQAPRFFYFPGLAAQPFLDKAAFPWVSALEAATDEIVAELQLILRDHRAFSPYLASSAERPYSANNPMIDNPDWSAFYLWKNGVLQDENARRCPATISALADVPLTQIANRSPTVLFSLLRPGAHIPAHNGLINTRLIVHLPLIIPGQCRLRVGNVTREWQRGRVWLFDDTIEHEAWNDSKETRVILILEVDRPDISHEEHAAIRNIFAAMDTGNKQLPEWEI
jgi:aspartate beta-hydroxylase